MARSEAETYRLSSIASYRTLPVRHTFRAIRKGRKRERSNLLLFAREMIRERKEIGRRARKEGRGHGINRYVNCYTHLREEFGHEIIGPADVDGHIVRHVIVVRLGLKTDRHGSLVTLSFSPASSRLLSDLSLASTNIFPFADSPNTRN